ncbi:uncharacterized protein LOC131951607 [Physella acuta]|uniref:uncharacterized protein LOC131951607 n=1 Tax=Physella acuta TaxID=109671 RepID=UPI0027DD508B|nr:uncharacterized protein LOC131951607 [Physella acuta]
MIFCVLTLGVLRLTLIEAVCDYGWFGPNCEYMCRCERKMCDGGGVCRDGARCQKGWFGPSCQYWNLINMNITGIEPTTEATDEQEDTCTFVQNLKISWKSARFEISWIRLIVRDKVNTTEPEVRLNGSATKCPDQTVSHYDRKTIDVYCNASSLVHTIHIYVPGLNVCSVYISGGRNVALRQATNESSRPFNSKLAVDGNRNGNYNSGSCTHSDSDHKNPTWEVRLTSPQSINRFVLYNRKGKYRNISS